ncbi:MAG: DegV family EDD domain-containing protein, partial [Bacteroidales bacterium]|nr:DegV family EDD domain-containing protein [Bacteroidales bacterium]
ALASGENIDKEALKHDLEGLGDSVVVAGNSNKVRMHVHTDTPEAAVRKLSERAHILTSKVDDMAFQVEIKAHRRHDIAVLVDSASDLDAEIRFKHQIHHVPLQVQLADSLFLDGVTLKHDDFYAYLATKQPYPKTSLPALKNIYNKLSYIATYYKAVIVLNLSSGVSGTHQAFVDMAKKVQMQTGVPIAVFDTKTLAGAQGLLALRVTEALDKGFSFEDLKRLIPLWCAQSNVYAMTKTVRYFIKGGRISRMKGWLATFLGLAPVVTPDRNGKGSVLFTAASQGKGVERVMKIVENKLKTGRLHAYAVEYTDQSARPVAEALVPRLKALTGKEPAFIGQVTPVVGSSAGLGTVALSTLME